jgi:uncharacterized protein (TIGR03118 family)
MRSKRISAIFAATLAFAATGVATPAKAGVDVYSQTNIVSDGSVPALSTDSSLINPWGLAHKPGGPWWIANNNSGVSTVYNSSTGAKLLQISVAPPLGINPTGLVANTTGSFLVNGTPANFIFDGEDGILSAWASGSASVLQQNNSATAVYKGLSVSGTGSSSLLYATNFQAGTVEAFNSSFQPTTLTGNFTDPNLPAGYAPFGIQNINNNIYVTYALQDAAKHDDVAGPGNGFVDVFNTQGVMQQRLISNGVLNSPWGLALAPADFGAFSNDLLVGNFGDGTINAFNPSNGNFLGTLKDSKGNPIVIGDLWSLQFGDGGKDGAANSLFFTAGVQDENHGLFGELNAAVPLPPAVYASLPVLAVAMLLAHRRRVAAI